MIISCAVCGDPTHSTELHEATLDQDMLHTVNWLLRQLEIAWSLMEDIGNAHE